MKNYSKKTTAIGIFIILCLIVSAVFLAIIIFNKQLGVIKENKYKEKSFDSDFVDAAEVFNGPLVIHPYLGFVDEYNKTPGVNKFGFIGPEPISKRGNNKVIIAIFGGSVAERYYSEEKDNFIAQLNTYPQFKDKQIEVYSIALGGFKQPQQLMALNYFLVLGGEFDIIINIDGFNEAALPIANNIPGKVSTFFPRAWALYARKSLNIDGIQLLGSIDKHKERINQIETIFSYPIIRNLNSIKNWLITREQNELIVENNKLADVLSGMQNSYQVSGPEKEYFSDKEINENIIKVWSESSIQMANLAKGNKILYLHFLQPNQYLPNSKNFSEEEKHTAYNKDGMYKEAIETTYPKFITEGNNLKEKGELFVDLSDLYKNINETIYVDDCCHLNTLGNNLITDELIKNIVANYSLN